MKRGFTYLFLVAYTVGIIKPTLPVISDIIAHTFQELEHTNTVHKHNGENHVHLEIEASEKEETNKNTSTHKIEVSVNPHFVCKIHYDVSKQIMIQDLNSVQ